MAVTLPPDAYYTPSSLPTIPSSNRGRSSESIAKVSYKWIDDELYKTTILSLYPAQSESEADEKLQTSARDLGLLPVQETAIDTMSSTLSETTISSFNQQGSIMSQSTAPTSCASSERRPSTSLSNKSSIAGPRFEIPTIVTEMERKRHSGFKSGLRKISGLRSKKRASVLNLPSSTSLRSQTIITTTDPPKVVPLLNNTQFESRLNESDSPHHFPPQKDIVFEPAPSIDRAALQRSLDCEALVRIRTQQLEEKRKFLEYQTNLIQKLLNERDKIKAVKEEAYKKRVEEQDEKNEKAVEGLEAHQLEDELKQQKEHEAEKRAIHTRLKHMEAYCRTPTPPQSPSQTSFNLRASEDSMRSWPERHVTQQHYENLAQAYHLRDNMDDLHAAKINVLRGKQKRALQNFMLKKERELEQIENEHNKEVKNIDIEYREKESEIRDEFAAKRNKLEARWKLQTLVERTRMERSTGLKFEGLPDIVVEA